MLRTLALLGAAGSAFHVPATSSAAPLSQRAAAATSAEMADVAELLPRVGDFDQATLEERAWCVQ